MISLELEEKEWYEVLEALALYKYALENSTIKNEEQIKKVANIQECIKAQLK